MSQPNKPMLAFAWIGAPGILAPLWSAMTQTPFQGELPRELLHRPQIIAADTETWSCRFSRCERLSELLYMRVNARRHSGLLWCKEAGTPLGTEEYKMLCYAGGCRLPIVVFLHGVTEATDEADQEEQGIRSLLDDLGLQADEAIFVYAKTKQPESISHLYQRLEQALIVTEERRLPPLMVRCEEADLLFFVHDKWELEALPVAHLRDASQALHATAQRVVRRHQIAGLLALTLHVKFEAWVSLRPEVIFYGKLRDEKGRELPIQECVVFV